jgi:hypothetical protein
MFAALLCQEQRLHLTALSVEQNRMYGQKGNLNKVNNPSQIL